MQTAEETQVTQLFEKFRTIYYDNDKHPLGCIRFCLYLFMNRLNQESYNNLPAELKNPVVDTTEIGTDIATEQFLNGSIGPYKNVMIKEYLTYLNEYEPGYFERLKKEHHQDPFLPPDKETFDRYALTISDYSIGRDYARGGECRRIYDGFKVQCWNWYDDKYRKEYNADPESVSKYTLLTLILCHLISKINMLAKTNQHIVDTLNLKLTFRKNAGTPKSSFIQTDLFTPRVRKSYLSSYIANSNQLKELTPNDALSLVKEIMLAFVGDFLSRDELYRYKRQKNLPVIQLIDTTLFESFWQDQEEIESLLLKLDTVLEKMIKDTKISTNDKINLDFFRKQMIDHKIYYVKARSEFTNLYKTLTPDDFYTPAEIEVLMQIFSSINILILVLINKVPENHSQQEQIKNNLKSLMNHIEKHIEYHVNSSRSINVPYQQYDALNSYQKLSQFIDDLLIRCNEINSISDPKESISYNYIVTHLVTMNKTILGITSVIDELLVLFTAKLTIDELKEIVFTLIMIKAEEFNNRLVELCISDLKPRRLADFLIKYCAPKISSDNINNNIQAMLDSSYSDHIKKTELKKLCLPTFTLAEIEEMLKANIIQELSEAEIKHELLKLTKIIAEEQKHKPFVSSAPLKVGKSRSSSSGNEHEIKARKNTKTSSGTFIPILPLDQKKPTDVIATATINQAVTPVTISDVSTPTLPTASAQPVQIIPLNLPPTSKTPTPATSSPKSSPKVSGLSLLLGNPLNLLMASTSKPPTPSTSPKLRGEDTAIPVAQPTPADSPKSKKAEVPVTDPKNKKEKEEKDKKGFFSNLFSGSKKKDDDGKITGINGKITGTKSDSAVQGQANSESDVRPDTRNNIERRSSKS